MDQSASSSANLTQLLNQIVSPVGLAFLGAYLTFFITRITDRKREDAILNRQRTAYIDLFILQIEKIIATLEAMIIDLDERGYYSYKNIWAMSDALNLLQRKIEDVIIFSNENLRSNIITTIDSVITVNTDIRLVEDLQSDERKKHTTLQDNLNRDLYNTKVQLLRIGIFFEGIIPKKINNKVDDELITAAHSLVVDLQNRLTESVNKVTDNANYSKDKRTVLSTRILDAQAKLRQLLDELENEKNRINKYN